VSRSGILITGANGFVGQALTHHLLDAGWSVSCAMRSDSMLDSEISRKITVPSVDGHTDWTDALSGCAVVIHLAARVHVMNDSASDPLTAFRKTNVEGTLNLARQASAAGVKRFIFISSIKVNGEQTLPGQPFTEADAAKPQDAYGQSKHEAEQGLMSIARQTGMEVVIIRPPLIYGAGVKANFASMLDYVKRGMPLPLGAIHNKRSFVYLGNLLSLIECCVEHPAAANQVFLVSDGNDLSTTELLRCCAAALGVKSRLLPVPQGLIEFCAVMLGKKAVAQRLCGNLQVDISKARSLLGWTPPVSVADGLQSTVIDLFKMDK
jgi:nucleoside-diphosphate-sugar epimerase